MPRLKMSRNFHYPESVIQVYCEKCEDWVNENKVTTLGIEEDFYGRDKLTFSCHYCLTQQTSLRVKGGYA